MKDRLVNRKVSRRGFATAAAGGTLVAGWSATFGGCVSSARAAGDAPWRSLGQLSGKLFVDDETRRAYAQDYGQIVHEMPLAVLLPGSVEDIIRTVRFARRHGLRIAARGRGHQPFGQAQVANGIVIDLQSLRAVRSVSAGRLEVDAGADWRTVVHAAASHGGALPVLPAFLGLTVGGTLSVGGMGASSFKYGAQVDQTLELQVATGEGDLVTCSSRSNRDVFEAALAGQGQCGIVTRATLRLVPAQPMVREYVLGYPDSGTLLQDLSRASRDDRFEGAVGVIAATPGGWAYMIVATRAFTPPAAPEDAALLEGLRMISTGTRDVPYLDHVDAFPEAPFANAHADLGLFVPGSAASRFVAEALPRLNANDLGGAAALRLFHLKEERFNRPLLRIPREETFVYAALIRAEAKGRGEVSRVLAGNRTLFDRNRALGGTLYPFCAVELTAKDWRRHYGDALHGLTAAKRRYDPDHVFASGPDWLGAGRAADGAS